VWADERLRTEVPSKSSVPGDRSVMCLDGCALFVVEAVVSQAAVRRHTEFGREGFISGSRERFSCLVVREVCSETVVAVFFVFSVRSLCAILGGFWLDRR